MKLLHTSDWHLGRALHGHKRHAEFEAFLDWCLQTLVHEQIDVLLIAGDIFDTQTPGTTAQGLYYRFLYKVARSSCRHVVVIAGNHDSPSLLNAPQDLLKALDIHVVGAPTPDPADEVLLLRTPLGEPELLVCAVPYLRDRDVRLALTGESLADKESRLMQGIQAHYQAVVSHAEALRAEYGPQLPMVGMGHLFTAGGQTCEGDGVRELYVGSLAHVPAALFPASLDYLALGHLHVPQKVGGSDTRRYSGSPLPMGFGEAYQQKQVCVVSFSHTDSGLQTEVKPISVPVFQRLERLSGDWDTLREGLEGLKAENQLIWLEVTYTGEAILPDLRQRLTEISKDSRVEILRVRNQRIRELALHQSSPQENLADLDAHEVFRRCLAAYAVPEAQHPILQRLYAEALQDVYNADLSTKETV